MKMLPNEPICEHFTQMKMLPRGEGAQALLASRACAPSPLPDFLPHRTPLFLLLRRQQWVPAPTTALSGDRSPRASGAGWFADRVPANGVAVPHSACQSLADAQKA